MPSGTPMSVMVPPGGSTKPWLAPVAVVEVPTTVPSAAMSAAADSNPPSVPRSVGASAHAAASASTSAAAPRSLRRRRIPMPAPPVV
jgi:hypothetical protein